jgi:hypothetical protein
MALVKVVPIGGMSGHFIRRRSRKYEIVIGSHGKVITK